MIRRLLFVASLLIAISNADAADFSSDSSSDSKISSDKNMSVKNSTENKDSKTKRKSKSTSTGKDKTKGSSDKNTGTVGTSGGLDVTLPAPLLFTDWQPPTARLTRDFGLTGDEGYGFVNVAQQEFLTQAARANQPISSVTDENAIRQYLISIAEAGAVLGQAQLYLQMDSGKIGNLQRREEDGTVEVRGLGQADLIRLAAGALKKAQEQIADQRINLSLAKLKADDTSCRFVGDLAQIQCGRAVLTLSVPPVLKIGGMPWYAADGFNTGFAGISASYKVSSSWSWNQALEDAKSDSVYAKEAVEASTAAEKLEAQGNSYEAAMTRRRAIEKMQKSGYTLSPSKFIPGIH